ncbi:hypothetical protein MKW98_014051 [Papaver atlanticum]|uniref:Uncharacterized protein n=1 Tax=Papaver atlanticum TaxID=357466 RepID=A0AAD4SL68_9MAGN|nr:hypothetical protein MKW98_014051 [Papaver atlanticum]
MICTCAILHQTLNLITSIAYAVEFLPLYFDFERVYQCKTVEFLWLYFDFERVYQFKTVKRALSRENRRYPMAHLSAVRAAQRGVMLEEEIPSTDTDESAESDSETSSDKQSEPISIDVKHSIRKYQRKYLFIQEFLWCNGMAKRGDKEIPDNG